jgi:hypothetical protein
MPLAGKVVIISALPAKVFLYTKLQEYRLNNLSAASNLAERIYRHIYNNPSFWFL